MSYVRAKRKRIRIPKKVERDYNFYLRWSQEFKMELEFFSKSSIIEDPNGYSSIECFHLRDTFGKAEPCREKETLYQIMNSKGGVNFTIQQWSEGIHDGLFCLGEFQEQYPWFPDWFWDSLMKEVWKLGGPGSLFHVSR